MRSFSFILLFFLIFMISCAPVQIIQDQKGNSFSSQVSIDKTKGLFLDLGIDLNTAPQGFSALQTKPFPTIRNNKVNDWLNYYSRGEGREKMRKNLEKFGRYGPYMQKILREEGLPAELIYVAMVESGLNSHARSPANAVGYWQFIPSTARNYGLKINSELDERRDFNLSTRAAAKYYKDLYNQFEDWPLSLAGYNCGERCVNQAIRSRGFKNFWILADRHALPKETRNYVPKVIAMSHIGHNPSFYGFHNINYQSPLKYEWLELRASSHYHFGSLSTRLNVDLRELKKLNPKYKSDHISGDNNHIRAPVSF